MLTGRAAATDRARFRLPTIHSHSFPSEFCQVCGPSGLLPERAIRLLGPWVEFRRSVLILRIRSVRIRGPETQRGNPR